MILTTEIWWNRKSEQKLFKTFQMIDKLLFDKFEIQINYECYQRKLRIGIWIVLFYTFIYGSVRFYYNIPEFLITDYYLENSIYIFFFGTYFTYSINSNSTFCLFYLQ